MATVHGGDGGNDPPRKSWVRKIWGCAGSGAPKKGRGKNQTLNLEKKFQEQGRLEVDFDTKRFKTWHAVGESGSIFKSYIGTLVRGSGVPMTYDSWSDVPLQDKAFLIPALNERFRLDHFINLDPNDAIRKAFERTITADAQHMYRNWKSGFKKTHFDAKGGLEKIAELEGAVPAGMEPEDWSDLLRFYQREDRVKRAKTNKDNRALQILAGTHGRQSASQYVDQYARTHEGEDPDLVEMYAARHKHADGSWEHPTAQANYDKLKEKKEERERDPVLTPQPELFPATFGNRPGHRRGLGRIVRGVGDTEYDYTHLTQPQGTPIHHGQGSQAGPSHAQGSQAGSCQTPFDLNFAPPQVAWFDPDAVFNWSAAAHAHGSQSDPSSTTFGSQFAPTSPFALGSINLGNDDMYLGNDDDEDNDNY